MWKSLGHVQLCDPMDWTVQGILQARILEWVAIPFFRRSSQFRDQTQVSHTASGFFTIWATSEAQNQGNTCQQQLLEHRNASIISKKNVGWRRPYKDKWGFLWLVSDGEACRDTSVWLKYRDQTMISKPISFASLHKGPWMSPLPTLSRTDWHLLQRTSLQNAECMSSLHTRLNKSPGKCFQWVPEMAVRIFF